MARPERKTVDYFPHYISDGKKMFYIEQKYGNDGYATWFKILESLASTDNHFLNLSNKMDLLFLSAKCRVSDSIILEILNDLSELGEIDDFLWMNKIVYSQKFIDSIQDAYMRRNNKCMSYEDFCIHFSSLCTTITKLQYDKKNGNTQSILNNNKSNHTKQNNIKEKENKLLLFDSWWHQYSYKHDSAKCKELWCKLSFEEINKILEVVSDYVKSTPDKTYRLKPMNYLKREAWNNEIIIKTLNNGTTNNQQQKRTLEQQAEDITARIFGHGSGQNQNPTNTDNGVEDIDFVFS